MQLQILVWFCYQEQSWWLGVLTLLVLVFRYWLWYQWWVNFVLNLVLRPVWFLVGVFTFVKISECADFLTFLYAQQQEPFFGRFLGFCGYKEGLHVSRIRSVCPFDANVFSYRGWIPSCLANTIYLYIYIYSYISYRKHSILNKIACL